jgi:hypothetical protein
MHNVCKRAGAWERARAWVMTRGMIVCTMYAKEQGYGNVQGREYQQKSRYAAQRKKNRGIGPCNGVGNKIKAPFSFYALCIHSFFFFIFVTHTLTRSYAPVLFFMRYACVHGKVQRGGQ